MVNSKRVFYTASQAPIGYAEMLGKRPDITLDPVSQPGPDAAVEPILSTAHAYQIGSARDELAPQLHAHADLLKRTPNLLIVSTGGAGYDTVDVKACNAAGVLVVNQTGGNKEAVAEHVVGLMICLSKRVMETDRHLRRGTLGDRANFIGHDVLGKTIGIVGIGNVGARVSQLCGTLFQMRVLAYDPYLTADEMKQRGAEKVELDDLLRNSDFVSINCPLTDETRGLIGAPQYALMRPNAYFINTARGFIHDEDALADALREADRRRRPRRLDEGAAGRRPSAAAIRQRDVEPAHRRGDARGARQHGPLRGRADSRCARRQAAAAHRQPGGLAGLRQALREDIRLHAAALIIVLPGRR